MTPEQLKILLRQYKLSPNKTYGQNFLLDDFVLQDIVDAAGIQSGEAVLEIGPGIGNLTEKLLERADFVLSIEKDPKFLPRLKALKKDHKNFRFEVADILSFDFQTALKDYPAYRLVANIPYYITGKIIQLFLRAKNKPLSITILVQKEVAQNLAAKPGRLNLLALSTQLYGDAKIIQKVPAKSFYPAPKVDSSIVQIELLPGPRYPDLDEKKLFRILRACFAGKRKQLHNTLINNLGLDREAVSELLARHKISTQARPQELSLDQWVRLSQDIEI
jgi:16S rRNA (adenine1518-N6/adenine1519-N6)-dimethyltransferase